MSGALKLQVAVFTIARMVVNTLFRMVYPFINSIGRGLGVDFRQVAQVLSWRALIGLTGPFFAALADRRGRKVGMLSGLALFTLGVGVVILRPSFLGFTVMLLVTTVGKFIFDPAIHAYIGDRVSYERRGAVLAVTELGWSGAFLLGVPIAGYLINRFGWLSPFPLIAALTLTALIILIKLLPGDAPAGRADPPGRGPKNPFANFSIVWNSKTALAGLATIVFVSMANETINLVFGVWLEDSFGLQVLALGGASAVIGLSELAGEGWVGFVTDRLGKKRAVSFGLVCNSLAALLLPVMSASVHGAFSGLFLFYLSFEFTFVSSIPMMTEILPNARATLMAFNIASASLGRAMAAWTTPPLYTVSFTACALAAALINLLALASVQRIRMDGER